MVSGGVIAGQDVLERVQVPGLVTADQVEGHRRATGGVGQGGKRWMSSQVFGSTWTAQPTCAYMAGIRPVKVSRSGRAGLTG